LGRKGRIKGFATGEGGKVGKLRDKQVLLQKTNCLNSGIANLAIIIGRERKKIESEGEIAEGYTPKGCKKGVIKSWPTKTSE